MRATRLVAVGLAMLIAACGGSAARSSPAQLRAGAVVVAETGCEACHIVGDHGNHVGLSLTRIGARLSPSQIGRALVDPLQPLPSFASLRPQSSRRSKGGTARRR